MKTKILLCIFILISIESRSQEIEIDQSQFLARMRIITDFIKTDSTTIHFLFEGDSSQICFNIDSASGFSHLIGNIDGYKIISFLIDTSIIKTPKEKHHWLMNHEKERKENYKPLQIKSDILDSLCSDSSCYHELHYNIIQNNIYIIFYIPSISTNNIMIYTFIFNDKNEIIFFNKHQGQ